MGSTNFCRGTFTFLFILGITSWGLKAQPIADFSFTAPVPNCNPAVYPFINLSTGVAPLSYKWNFGVYPGVNSVFQDPSTTYLNCGDYTVQLIVTDGNGDKDTATQNITVYCMPTANYSVDNVSGCIPMSVSFNSSTSVAGSGTITGYVWDYGDGFAGMGSSPNHTYVDEGCKQVTLILTNSFGCVNDTTISDVLCVYTPPSANFTSSATTSCSAPFVVNYTDSSSAGLAPYTYQWIFEGGDPATDTSANPTVTYNAAGSFGTTLIVTDANGCTDTIVYDNYVVIANNTANITLNTDHGCPPLTVSAAGVASSTPIGWSWTITPSGTITNATSQTPSVSITDTGVFSLCLTIDFGAGCLAQNCTTITTHTAPNAYYTIDGLLATCLRPAPVSFIDSSTGSNLSYAWSFPSGIPASANTSTPDTINYVACGTYSSSLTVTDDFGCTDSYATPSFLTITCPVANFTLDPSSGCIPLSVNFNSTTSTGNPVQWDWNFGDPASGAANTDNSQNPAHTYNTPGCYTITLITTSAEGCKDTIVIPNAVCCSTPPDVAFIATPLINCANLPIYFTNQSTGTFPYSTYTWDFHGVPPYNNESNLQNPAYIYEDTGWFDVTLIVSNYGCNDTLTIVHYVHLLPPVAHIAYTRSCAQPFVINFDGSASLGADTYTWVIPGGNPGVAFTPTVSVTYTTTGNHTVSLFVTNDSTGCTDNTSVTVTIRNVAAHFTGSPLSGCAPLTSCMSNTSVDAVSYAWLVTNSSGTTVATSTATSPCFVLATPGVYSVRLIATDQFGCKDTLYRPSYITVWGPIANFIGFPLSGCTPLLVNFTDQSTAPTSTITGWSWNFGDPTSGVNNTSTLQNPSHTYNNAGYYTVTLVVTDNHGCTNTKTRTNYIHAIHPDASFILTDTTVCLGTTACFINTSAGTGLTYDWDFGNGITSTSSNPCYTYTVNGNYSITLIATDATGCIDTATYADYVNVTHPTANLVADTLGSSCPPLTVHFTNLSVDAPLGSTYFWKFGDGQVSSAQNPSHIYNIAGIFDVTLIVTNPNGCKDTIVFNDYITIGGPQGYISLLPTSGCVPHYTCFQAVSSTTINFTWNFGDGTVTVNGDSICHTYTTTGSFYSELILNDGVGCVYALPIGIVVVNGANCAFNLDNPFLCQHGTVQFTDSSYGTSPVSQWDWNFGDVASGAQNTSALQNPNHYFASPGTYVINLDITTVDGCTNSATDTVVVAAAPVTYFDRVDSSTCAPDSVHFFDQTISSSPIVSYFWNFDDPASGAANTDTLPNTVHFYPFPGTYNVTLTTIAANGCSDSRTLPVYVHDTVIADAGPDQIICSGTSALLTASGGVQYVWTPATGLSNPNISSPIASPAVTTTYTVTVSNIYGCFDVDSTVVTVVPLPIITSVTHNNDTCGVDHAQAIVLASGGTPGYTYNWNSTPVQTNDSAINLHGNQTYTVIVTDANGCTVSNSVFITDLSGPNATALHTNTTCGNINGTAWVTTTSGNGGNVYVWNTGATTTTISPLAIGAYTVTVTDQFGCSNVKNTTVSNTAGPTGTIAANPTTCSNNNSFVNLSLSGGTAPFLYIWNTGATTQDLNNQLAGSYDVTITDANGCTFTVSKTVTDQPSPSLSLTQVNATCQVNNASIDVTVTNGTAPFIYNWNNNAYNTQDLSSIYSGTYSLTITDANGCTDAITTIITDTPVPSIAFTTISSTCGSSNGSIDITVTGGVTPYTYIWWNGETTQDLDSIPAGNYGITILGANGCTVDTIINLNDITAPALTINVTNNTCGLVNGSIDLSLVGGTLPFIYQWSGGETTQDVSNLAIGTYNVTVTDGNGCLAFGNTTLINIPGALLASTSANSTCGNSNGSVDLIVTGGTAPFSYNWDNGATTEDLNGVASGIYNVTVTDANGCTAVESSTVNNTDGPSITYITQNSTCGNSNGAIDLTVVGGTAPYIFDWNSGAFTTEDILNQFSGNYDVTVTDQNGCTIGGTITLNNTAGPALSATTSNPTCGYSNGSVDLTVTGGTSPINIDWNSGSYSSEDLDSLYPGTYTVIVTDSNNCSASLSEVLIDVAGPTASAVAVDVTCAANNGTITLTLTGGTSPYSFIWSNGETTQSLTNLSTGIYSVTVVDANLCSTAISTIVSDVPGPFSSSATTNATCGNNNGSIDLSVVAGVAPYNYSWSNGGTTQDLIGLAIGWYFVTITDQNNCVLIDSAEVININGPSLSTSTLDETCGSANGQVYLTVSNGTSPYVYQWSNGALTQDLNYVPAGTYVVTVTDNNGCTATTSSSFINIPGPTSLSFGSQNSTCGNSNGMVWVSVTGGTSPYSYHWNTSPVQVNDTAYNLNGGASYSVTVTDVNLCTIGGTITLTNIAGPTYSIAHTNCTCAEFNGAIALTTISGTAPYTYTWSNGETTEDIDSLQPGAYSVTVADANGCTVTATATITNIFGPYLSYTFNNTTCGNNNGSIDLTVSGGTAPFFYDWNSGQFATQDLVNLAAGVYSIHLADAAGCQVDTVVSLTDIAGPTVTATPQNSTCGYNNGSVVATISGGSSPFTYSWSNASIDSFAVNLIAGNYTVSVTDTNGCLTTASVVVSNITGPSATATHIDETCGNNNASIDLVIIGGTSPFTYDWNSGTYSTQDLSNLSQGTYFVVVTDSNGCQVIALQNVDSLPAPSLTSSVTAAPCSNITGAIDITVTGGTSPFNYNWSNGATTEDLNSLTAGIYTLTFTDGSGCSVIDSFTVTGTIQPALSHIATNANCGNAIGSIDLTITNGTSPFTITWSNGATTEDIDSLGAGLYVVHVIDSAGCTASDSAIIVQNFSPELTISSTNESCSGNDGTVSLDIVGGTFPLTFIWSNGATIEDITGLSVGTYYVTVTDANGCTAEAFADVINTISPAISYTSVNTYCGQNTGSIDVSVFGGSYPLNYMWSNGATTEDLSLLVAGIYTLTITDAANCVASQTITITDAPLISIADSIIQPSCLVTSSINLTVTGGMGSYSYLWSTGATTSFISGIIASTYFVTVTDSVGCVSIGSYVINPQTSVSVALDSIITAGCNNTGAIFATVTGGSSPFNYLWSNGATTEDLTTLSQGTYDLTVTDSLGCIALLSATISNSTPPSTSIVAVNANCNLATGSIDLTATGGTTPYSYIWNNGSTVQDISSLLAGNYFVTVTDALGCSTIDSNAIVTSLAPTTAITFSNATCAQASGSVDLTVSGGTSPYNISWNNGSTTEDLSGVAAGNYSVTVFDVNGCSVTDSTIVSNSNGPSATSTQINSSCGSNNGSIDLTVTGGTSPYTFVWSNGATTEDIDSLFAGSYQVTVIDASGCNAFANATIQTTTPATSLIVSTAASCNQSNGSVDLTITGISPIVFAWSNGSTTEDLASVSAGTYSVVITDSSGCVANDSVVVNNSNGPTLTGVASNSTCGNSNGSIDVTVSGGSIPYNYNWSNGSTTEDVSSLVSGTYTVTVTDATGCFVIDSFVVINTLSASLSITSSPASCTQATGTIDLTIVGGTSPFNITWSNGATTEDLSGVLSGVYFVTVTDASGCSTNDSVNVAENQGPEISFASIDAGCSNNNGSIDLSISGGIFPFTFLWNNGATTEDLIGISAGNYIVVVTDVNGCTANAVTDIFAASSPSTSIIPTSASCNQSNGSVDLTITGGISPYNYIWNNGQTIEDLNNISSGTYFVTVTDVAGCAVVDSAIISNTNGPSITSSLIQSTCGNANGSIDLTIIGGSSPYNYFWNNGTTSQDETAITAGNYFVTVTDATGCSVIDSFTITTSASPTLTSSSVNASCGQADGAIDLAIAGGISPYSILWSNAATTEDLSSVIAGNYSVTVTDATGCTASDIVSVSNSNGPAATVSTINSSCGNNNGSIDITVTGGTSPYTYNWNNGTTNEDIDSLFAGNYQVTITDASGCNAYAVASVLTTIAPNLILSAASTNCNQSNGSVNLTVIGGTGSFNYTWSNGATTEDITSLFAGNYIVTVTDSLGCYSVDSIPVSNLNGPTISIITTQPSCLSAITYLDLNVAGGVGAYSYNWSNGATYQDIFSPPAGNYYVTVTDAAGCSVIDSAAINSFSSPSILIDTVINANCSITGSIAVTVSGGNAPYNYSWNNGATTDNISNLLAGNYSLTVTDASGCIVITSSNITSTVAPAVSMTTVSTICNQSNGSIDLTVTGGAIPYNYSWNNGSTAQDISNVAAGSYTVTVTDLNNCVVIDSVFVGNTAGPVATDIIVQPSCTASTGSIDLTVTGGAAPYGFAWNNGSTTEDLNSISGGFYDVTISDASGCQTFGNYLLVGIAPVSVTVNTVSPICVGDSVQLNAFGAATYSWAPNFGLSATTGSGVWASPSVSMTYTVTGFNILGCFDTAMVVVTVHPVPTISATQTSSLICYGDSAKIVASGGTSYTWSPSSSLYFTSFTTAFAHPTSITTYTITGTNAFGCASSTVIVVDVLPQFIMTVSSPDTELCSGESTTLIATGAVNYTWSPSTGLSATTGANVTATPTQSITYYVTGINANGCDLTDSVIVIVHPPVVVNINPVNPTICIGSSINLNATGAINYIWSPSQGLNTQIGPTVIATPTVTTTYIVTGTDSFGCVGFNAVIVTIGTSLTLYLNNNAPAICNGTSTTLVVNGAFNATYDWTPSVTFLDSTGMTVTVNPNSNSTYTVLATDNNGCTGTTTATVTVNNPPVISATNATACYGSSTALSVNGAVNYSWSPVAGLSSSTGANQIAAPDSTTTYTIIGTDLNGCADTTQSIFVVNPLPVLSATPSVTSICNGSSATITASGAIAYQWVPSQGLSSSTGTIVTAQPLVSTTYTIFGTDSTGCSNSVTAIVNVGAPVNIINTPLYPTLCLGDSLVISLAGASTYQWTPSIGLSASTGATVVATPLVSTVYTITGTDLNGCTGSAIVSITVYPNIVVNGTSASVCEGSSVTLTASGAYFYIWTPDPTLNSYYDSSVIATPVVNTTYTLTAMNMYGCIDTALFAVNINPIPVVNLDGLDPFYCVATLPDTLIGTPAGGILSGYGVTGNTFNPPIAGIGGPYLVTYTYTDSLGCSNADTDTTQVGNTAMIIASSVNSTICNGSSAILNAMGGVTFVWSPSNGLSNTSGATVIANPTSTTTYYVSGTNAAGCVGADSIVVIVAPLIPLSISANADSICSGSSTSIIVTGALTYAWSPAVQSSNANGDTVIVSPSVTSTYTVTGVNAGGCSTDATVVINVLSQPVVTVNSPGICSGDAALLIAQGASTYNWISIGSTNDSVTVQPLVTTSYIVVGSVNSCSDTAIAVVSMLAAPIVSVNNDTICSGSTATLVANGASNYTWLPMNVSGSSVSVSPTVTSTYTLIGNNGSCVDTTIAIVVVNNSPVVSFSGLQPIYCSNNSIDTLVGVPSGGIFSGAGVSGNIFDPNAVSGNSTITYSYTDINGCSASDSQTTVINGGAAVTVNPPLSTICNSSAAFITASGANTYTWSPSTGLNTTTGAQVEAMPTSSITYTVTGITANGCSGQATAIVNIASNLVLSINATNDSICAGQTISITALGGTDYIWSPTTFLSSSTGSTVSASPTSNITYTVIATNAGGCSGQTSIPITMLPNPVVTVTSDTVCAGQFATLVASGATNYHWSTNALGNTISVNPATSASYIVIGMNGACADTATAFVSVNPLPVISAVSSGSFICNGGTVQLDASGATTYSWSPSTGLNNTTGSSITASLTSSETFTVIGTDSSGCINSQSVPVTVALPVIITTNLIDTTICYGQSVILNAGGANNFIWTPSTGLSSSIGSSVTASPNTTTTYTIIGTDINGCTGVILITVKVNPIPTVTASSTSSTLCASSSSTLTAFGAAYYIWSPSIGLSSSTGSIVSAIPTSSIIYSVTGIDSFGCAASASINIVVLPVPIITINSTNPTICLGASTTLSASGANTYSWSPSSNLNSTTNSSVTANPIATTTYSVSAIDSNGCSATSTSVVTVQQPPILNLNALDSTLCFGHSTILSASGGTTYNWSPSIGLSATSGNSITANPSVNSTYTVTAIDAFGCQAINQIAVYVLPNPVINVTPNNPTICPGDFTTLVAMGALNYQWSTNALGDSISVNPISNTSYTVTGTDANGCSAIDTALVTINSLPTISAASTQNNFCQGQTTIITASGGIDYTWYPASGLNATTGSTVTANPFSTTTYTIVGTNSNGCTNLTTIEITIYQLPMAAAGPDVELCEGSNVQLNATGGTSYEWSPQTGLDNPYIANPIASPSFSTSYIINVGNQNGCHASDTINISVHMKPLVNAGQSQTVCFPDTTLLHGDGATFYQWFPSDYLNDSTLQSPTCTPQFDITYTLTISDSFGCAASDTVTVKVKRPFNINADPDISICRNSDAQLNATGGFNYQWSPSMGLDNPFIPNPTASPSFTTTYTVYSSDGICFSSEDTVVVTVNQLPQAFVGADVELLYGSTYQLYGYTNSGNILWTPSDFLNCNTCADPIVNHLNTPMTYIFSVTDSMGCRAEDSVHISLTCNEDLVYVPNAFTPNGDNKNDEFRIRTYGLSQVKAFRVFNRWGEMVFETYDVSKGWDGTYKGEACAPAVFVYYLEGTCANGQSVLKQGNVTLIR